MLVDETAPFVLLDDARVDGAPARLYRQPVEVLEARDSGDVGAVLDTVRAATKRGLHAAGFLSYEVGAAFERALPPARCDRPLAWFGLFEAREGIAREDVPRLLPDPAGALVGAPTPVIDREEYGRRFDAVQGLIRAGDLYQANLTFQATVPILGHPLAAYAAIRTRAAAGWGAIVATGGEWLLSFSPELFLAIKEGAITCRPMKGTTRRGEDAAEDRALAEALASDDKQRAENLMIVDLMRNDLSRVAVPGSVAVSSLFAVEHYPTVHQMVSTVTATLAPGRDAVDALAAAFPCGSITGAPKLRAIEALAVIEGEPRGAYTGAIGAIAPDGDAQFNVAIRTLTLAAGTTIATMGLGGGIVADSRVDEEWDEALAKGAFLTAGQRTPDLIETMAFDPEAGIALLERHLERMKASAAALGFAFDRHGARNELQAATFRLRGPARVRLLASSRGGIAIESTPLPATPAGPVEVAIVPLPVDPSDYRLRHKTTQHAFYDAARAAAGTFEVAFVRRDGWLTEGSFTNLFVERDGVLLTPPLARGLLPGVLRAELIESGRAREQDLTVGELAGGFLVGNALRGLLPAIVAVAK